MQPQIFMKIFHFATLNIKKVYNQELRFNKINNFYSFTDDILQVKLTFFFLMQGCNDENTITANVILCPCLGSYWRLSSSSCDYFGTISAY